MASLRSISINFDENDNDIDIDNSNMNMETSVREGEDGDGDEVGLNDTTCQFVSSITTNIFPCSVSCSLRYTHFHDHKHLVKAAANYHLLHRNDRFMAKRKQHIDLSQCCDGEAFLDHVRIEFDLFKCYDLLCCCLAT